MKTRADMIRRLEQDAEKLRRYAREFISEDGDLSAAHRLRQEANEKEDEAGRLRFKAWSRRKSAEQNKAKRPASAPCGICHKPTSQAYGPDGSPCHAKCWRRNNGAGWSL